MEEQGEKEFIDYLRIIWKQKWFIFIFSLSCAVIVGLIDFSKPNIYESFMLIEPGVIGLDPESGFITIEPASNIKSKIISQVYNSKVLKMLNKDPLKENLRFDAFQLPESTVTKVSLETIDMNQGIQTLACLFQVISEEYKPYIDSLKLEIDQKISLNKRRLELYKTNKEKMENDLAMTTANVSRISEERNALLRNENNNADKLSLLIYTNIMQQNISYNNTLKNQLGELLSRIESTKSEVETLELKKKYIQSIRLIQPPQTLVNPIKPKRKMDFALSFIVGLIFSIFVCLFIDYIQKTKSDSGNSITSK